MPVKVSKLPKSDKPLIADPDLAHALEKRLSPLTGAKLERAQQAIIEVRNDRSFVGTYQKLLKRYLDRIEEAIAA